MPLHVQLGEEGVGAGPARGCRSSCDQRDGNKIHHPLDGCVVEFPSHSPPFLHDVLDGTQHVRVLWVLTLDPAGILTVKDIASAPHEPVLEAQPCLPGSEDR